MGQNSKVVHWPMKPCAPYAIEARETREELLVFPLSIQGLEEKVSTLSNGEKEWKTQLPFSLHPL